MPQDNIEITERHYANKDLIPDVIKLLDEGHTVTLRLRGISMRPFLEDNRDKALITKARNPRRGDVVLAEVAKNVYVLHRIVKISGDDVTLRGDGNLHCEHCKTSDVHGFAMGFYRKGRQTIEKTNELKWRIYSFLWMHSLFLRRYMLAVYRRLPSTTK